MNWQTLLENWKTQIEEKSFNERFRLFDDEKVQIFVEARRLLKKFLAGEETEVSPTLPLGKEIVDMDVAYWVEGKVRGSRILLGKPVSLALKECIALTARDERFAPLQLSEFNTTRISITFFSPVRRQLTEQEWQKNEIDPTRAYTFSRAGKTGWYLPAVHNALSFKDLRAMLLSLAQDKAGYQGDIHYQQFHSFRVIDFMESENHEKVLEMVGPLVKKDIGLISEERLLEMLRSSVNHLIGLQRSDGNIPAIMNSRGEIIKDKDPLRLSSVGRALILAGRVLEDEEIINAGEKTALATEHFLKAGKWGEEYTMLSQAYLGQLYIMMNRKEEAERWIMPLFDIDVTSFQPISRLQRLTALLQFSQLAGERFERDVLKKEIDQFTRDFLAARDREEIELATYPELIHVLILASGLWGREWEKKIEEFVMWYEHQQLSDGAFPARPHSSFSYTRGTGKIFEVLALTKTLNDPSIQKVLGWLSRMQYDTENVFFMAPKFQSKAKGGFRHDAFHRELWNDSASHFLIGCARLLNSEKGKE